MIALFDERVLDVDEDAARRVDVRELLDGENGVEERRPGAAVLLGDLDPHQAELEEALDQVAVDIFASWSMSWTSGRIFSIANSRTLCWNIFSSSESSVSGAPGRIVDLVCHECTDLRSNWVRIMRGYVERRNARHDGDTNADS